METENQKAASTPKFWDSTEGKTKSNKIEIPSITLPKGGGAIRGIDEKFSVNAANGTSSFSIPLPASEARGFSPTLALQYSSGGGNGIFGLGWSLDLASIKRKTDKKLPEYIDHQESDVFVLSGAEDLVPEFRKNGLGQFVITNGDYEFNENDRTWNGIDYKVKGYLPRVESGFARIEKWTAKNSGRTHWRTISGTNTTTLFGYSDESKIFDPENETHVFEWLIEFSFDDRGNCIYYQHRAEDEMGLPSSLHNRNRKKTRLLYTNRYPKRILYGIRKPYAGNGSVFSKNTADYFFETVFDYGDHETAPPHAEKPSRQWNFRNDAFSEYKSGFEIRTTRLCERVLHYHHFQELPGGTALVNSIGFTYGNNGMDGFSFLQKVKSSGHIKKTNGSYSSKSLPELEFRYQQHDWNTEIRTVHKDSLVHAPAGIGNNYTFTDLFSEGLPGILTEQANGWHYKSNLGAGKFSPAALVSPKPSFQGLNQRLQLMELEGNGIKQLVHLDAEPKGYFELSPEAEWQSLRLFERTPSIKQGPHTRMIDLNGDGVAEMVISEQDGFSWYGSEGKKGYSSMVKRNRSFQEEEGAVVDFATQQDEIFLADMSGDGFTDLVRIRNGEICYWPNLGYGRFGRRITMDNAPLFDHPEKFNPKFIHLADIDGSGTSDIIYLGKNKCSIYLNQQGNGFSAVREIEPFLPVDNNVDVDVIDLLGNGVSCITWNDPNAEAAPLKYIDLMNSKKPHVLTGYANNMGKDVELEYRPSTSYYLEDKAAGKPWITKLHFPVQCVSRTITKDLVTGVQFSSHYRYRHGYFDHEESEFRGFGMVEQTDTETFEHWIKSGASNIVERDLHQDPVLTRTWFHTGAFEKQGSIFQQYEKEYWYNEMRKKGIPVTHLESAASEFRLIATPVIPSWSPAMLSNEERRQAARACKNTAVRSEVFALDAPLVGATSDQIRMQLTPFTVNSSNCVVELLQPKGPNQHAVFIVKKSESFTYDYEREADDPRISHTLNIAFDQYANVLESAGVVYGRQVADPGLPIAVRTAQAKTLITYSKTHYTNDIIETDKYRLPLVSEALTYELKNVTRSGYYKIPDFIGILGSSSVASYHEVDKQPASGSQKRLIEHIRNIYLDDDLVTPLGIHQQDSLGVIHESYQLAFSPGLIADLYDNRVDAALLQSAGYLDLDGDQNWWLPSGRTHLLNTGETRVDSANRFYVPVSFSNANGTVTTVSYYSDYFLLIKDITDETGNKEAVELYNFRTLAPQRLKDCNLNISETITDELGMVKAIAVFGKGNEADNLVGITEFSTTADDALTQVLFSVNKRFRYSPGDQTTAGLLKNASARFVYDLDAFRLFGKPVAAASIVREEHFQVQANSPLQLAFEYSNGLGQVIMKKMQAEPGLAWRMVNGTRVSTDTTPYLRWIGDGRTILNNKGTAVKSYEPYFSFNHLFESEPELVETGVTSISYFDALNRVMKVEMPDGTETRQVYLPWKNLSYDQNDTVDISRWYLERKNRLIDAALVAAGKDPAKEEQAAEKSFKHNNTPTTYCTDPLGHAIFSIEHNRDLAGADGFYQTKVVLDIEGNIRNVEDARGNVLLEVKYDMLGNKVYQKNMDTGKRWLFQNVLGSAFRTWDERNFEYRYEYDLLDRPLFTRVIGGDGAVTLDHIVSRTEYGETAPNAETNNIRSRVIRQYDSGGLVETPAYDFHGYPVSVTRWLAKSYKSVANWTNTNLVSDLETAAYSFQKKYDATGRVKEETDPGGNIFKPSYNEAGLLKTETIFHLNQGIDRIYIKKIEYNEKRQRTSVTYGNDVIAYAYYDVETFRMRKKKVVRADGSLLQELEYTFDASGNVTHIHDKAIATEFYRNMRVEPANQYTYDCLYRLIEAKGRENSLTLLYADKDNWEDNAYKHDMNPGDPMMVRNYTQAFTYDEVGNILQMKHTTSDNSANWWTRDYQYDANSNRLKGTTVGHGNQSFSYAYEHHPAHGFIKKLPHLELIDWNYKEDMIMSVRQRRTDGGTPETTWYQYDGAGKRLRKITENQAAPGVTPTKKEERIYVSGYEKYNLYSGTHAGLERVTLGLMDEGHRFVLIETRNHVNDGTEQELVRYQVNNHLGSSVLELDGSANAIVISYEEYHPFGTTAYQAKNNAIKSARKRYRFTGMERDEETGLQYHNARYYLPWLGRWLSADPSGIKAGVNVYSYADGNVLRLSDRSGLAGGDDQLWFSEHPVYDQEAIATKRGRGFTKSHYQNARHLVDVWGGPESFDLGHVEKPFYKLKAGEGSRIRIQPSSVNRSQGASVEAAEKKLAESKGEYTRKDGVDVDAPDGKRNKSPKKNDAVEGTKKVKRISAPNRGPVVETPKTPVKVEQLELNFEAKPVEAPAAKPSATTNPPPEVAPVKNTPVETSAPAKSPTPVEPAPAVKPTGGGAGTVGGGGGGKVIPTLKTGARVGGTVVGGVMVAVSVKDVVKKVQKEDYAGAAETTALTAASFTPAAPLVLAYGITQKYNTDKSIEQTSFQVGDEIAEMTGSPVLGGIASASSAVGLSISETGKDIYKAIIDLPNWDDPPPSAN